MSNGMSSSRRRASTSLPENPIVRHTSKALEDFFVAALGALETKMKGALQSGSDASPLNGLVLELTQDMISQLSQSVSRALGAAAPPDLGTGGTTEGGRRARRRTRSNKPARRRER